ncbi:Response regulator [Sulfidibacter corallicola]|uniref:Response regulator n=1 Tax=Sulfidibacter corallicola TaxID=2818388 RepID=A0A8A4TV44_SULCO|nr:response regulator [Sulfidibacter corallicola]QTD52994.1 response regulator [Sulfidibacter corallicola]
MSPKSAILLLEDDAFTRRMMQLHLEGAGYSVTAVENGVEGQGALEGQSFDLVLTDVMMPEMDGLTFLAKVREVHNKESLPVLMLTAMNEGGDRTPEFLEKGANDLVSKSKDPTMLLYKVRLHLELNRLREFAARGGGGAEPEFRGPNDGLWSWDLQNGQVNFSTRWKKIIGHETDEIENNLDEWFSRIHPADFEMVSSRLRGHQARESSHFEADYRMKHKDGSYHWVHDFGVAIFGTSGRAMRMIGAMSWILPRKEWEREHKIIAHELLVLRNMAQELKAYGETNDDLGKTVENLGDHLDLLTGKIKTLLGGDFGTDRA